MWMPRTAFSIRRHEPADHAWGEHAAGYGRALFFSAIEAAEQLGQPIGNAQEKESEECAGWLTVRKFNDLNENSTYDEGGPALESAQLQTQSKRPRRLPRPLA